MYRLGRSPVRERFVLKGAMLLQLWADQPYRSTLDLDLLAHGRSHTESVSRDIAAICSTDVEDDGIRYDPSSLDVEPIRAQDEYSGVRVVLSAVVDRSIRSAIASAELNRRLSITTLARRPVRTSW